MNHKHYYFDHLLLPLDQSQLFHFANAVAAVPIAVALAELAVAPKPITVAFEVDVSVILLSLPATKTFLPTTSLFKPNTLALFVFYPQQHLFLECRLHAEHLLYYVHHIQENDRHKLCYYHQHFG